MPAPRPADVARRLEGLLRPALAAAGLDLEAVSVAPAGRRSVVRVVVDADGGLDLDAVAEASHATAEVLDTAEADGAVLLPGAYVLEVTSPGVDRPLTAPRHWQRARTRLVTATLADRSEVTGRVVAADELGATLAVDGADRTLPYAEVTAALVQVEFSRTADDDRQGGA